MDCRSTDLTRGTPYPLELTAGNYANYPVPTRPPDAVTGYHRIYPLLQNFLGEAAAMIASGGSGLRLRFGSDDILVKFLLNENETSIPVKTDVAPYYHWQDVKRYWAGDC